MVRMRSCHDGWRVVLLPTVSVDCNSKNYCLAIMNNWGFCIFYSVENQLYLLGSQDVEDEVILTVGCLGLLKLFLST